MKPTLLFLLLFYSTLYSQSEIKTYPSPPLESNTEMHNNDYSVRIRTIGGTWQNLYEYKTYVNSGQSRFAFEESSFVTFDFKGAIQIEVTSNWKTIEKVLIRPQHKNIPYLKHGNKVYFYIDSPGKISFEINDNRYRNLQIFANEIETVPPSNLITKTFYSHIINELPNNEYIAKDNDVIYFEPGAIVKGRIVVSNKKNVKILGRGIIDISHLRKQYSYPENAVEDYEYIHGISIKYSENVSIKGIIINDPQIYAIEVLNSDYLDISNVKIFTRVLWGDGINMVASNNINIDDCFIRTADDCIAIYATRIRDWDYIEGDATNIKVTNSSFYADAAHPIEIGWHGNRKLDSGNIIYNVNFNNIDILEHDEPLYEYQGAISINCSDENRCIDFQFNNIRVEDFKEGRLLNIKVEPAKYGAAITDGDKIRNISFYNLSYKGSGENPSIIKGLNCERHVDGVHFQDLKINNQIIKKLSEYSFETNNYAYNPTLSS